MSVATIKILTSSNVGTADFQLLRNDSRKQRIRLSTVMVMLVTDATVVNRFVRLRVLDKDGVIVASTATPAEAASWTYINTFSHSVTKQTDTLIASGDLLTALPKLWLEPYESLHVSVNGGVVGDSFYVKLTAYTEKVSFSN